MVAIFAFLSFILPYMTLLSFFEFATASLSYSIYPFCLFISLENYSLSLFMYASLPSRSFIIISFRLFIALSSFYLIFNSDREGEPLFADPKPFWPFLKFNTSAWSSFISFSYSTTIFSFFFNWKLTFSS